MFNKPHNPSNHDNWTNTISNELSDERLMNFGLLGYIITQRICQRLLSLYFLQLIEVFEVYLMSY